MKKLRLIMLVVIIVLLTAPLFAETQKTGVDNFGGWHTILTALLGVLSIVASSFAGKLYKTISRIRGFIDAIDNAFKDHKITEEEWSQIVNKLKEIAGVWQKKGK
ncbi:MAG TPA: hypothetical protein DHM37_00795 [Candidatus Cloacimonas sp.]|jgi:hypothetical protein|nr:hypothetical protein [Candidatus Cloacimonas sp.]